MMESRFLDDLDAPTGYYDISRDSFGADSDAFFEVAHPRHEPDEPPPPPRSLLEDDELREISMSIPSKRGGAVVDLSLIHI